jgi:hypothetical protein
MKKQKKKTTYFWQCHWSNGKGGYDPDLESCRARGKATHTTALAAAQAGVKHAEQHGWCGWGYAPLGWESSSTNVDRVTPTGRENYVGNCREIVEKAEKIAKK